jgi:hypothetical protein
MALQLPSLPRRVVPIVQIVGGVIFAVSFFLPAVYQMPEGRGAWFDVSGPRLGLSCAFWSLMGVPAAVMGLFHPSGNSAPPGEMLGFFLAGLAGLVNPFLLCYLFATAGWRRMLAKVVVAGLVCAAAALAMLRYPPRVGFFLWVVGALAILVPQLALEAQRRDTDLA